MPAVNTCTTTTSATSICTVCTGQSAIPAQPARVVNTPNPGWNAGANSILRLDGDVAAQWSVRSGVAGVVCGLALDPREDVTSVASITHGWYASTFNGALIAQPYEAGVPRGTAQAITSSSALRVERTDGAVTYLVDGVLKYTSLVPSSGPQLMGAVLFSPDDTITDELFEHIGDESLIVASAALRYRGFGSTVASFASGVLRFGARAQDADREPVGPLVAVATAGLRYAARATLNLQSVAAAPLRYRAFGSDVATYAGAPLRLLGQASDQSPDDGISLMQSQGYLDIVVGAGVRIPLYDALEVHANLRGQSIWHLEASARLSGRAETVLTGLSKLVASANLMDSMTAIWRMLLEDDVLLGDTPAQSLRASARLIENLLLTAGPGSTLSATHAVLSTLGMADTLARIHAEQMSDEVSLTDALNKGEHAALSDGLTLQAQVAAAMTHRLAMLEQLLLADTANGAVVFHVAVADSVDLSDGLVSVLEALTRISDGILLTATFAIDNGVYTAWVCHTAQRAFTQYENYPFNSFAELGGQYLGAAPDGIYELTGDDDNGVPITSRIRTALDNLGTGRMKRMPSMYLGYSSSGTVALKVITTSDAGEKEENWYQLTEQPANVTREGRIKLGRGLKSVYWQFELISVSGARFALDDVQLFPLILDRRI